MDVHLDLTNTVLEVDVWNVDELPNEEYALLRKNGLGTSDASVVLGVSPYTTRAQLIAEKVRTHLTAEEKAVGQQSAVLKGLHLEPLIIKKFQEAFKQESWKPKDMYKHVDYPFMKFNYDGVTGTRDQYIPAEIKVVTERGERHYNPTRAMFNEIDGFRPIHEDVSSNNWSIETKAAFYGIPAYYYTQLQQQILGLKAPFGYLSVLFERDWIMHTFFAWADKKVHNELIVQGWKVWQQIEMMRGMKR